MATTKQALIIRHSASESLASNYAAVLEGQGFHLEPLNVFESAPRYDHFSAPDLRDVSLILVLGGPLSANDGCPALQQELAYIGGALAQAKPVFGVCLGSQLMAVALGATVEPTGGYQFGLRKIFVTAAGSTDPVFSKIVIPLVPTLHGESFSLPADATGLAEGFVLRRDRLYKRIHTAFRYRNSYGFQFEPQLTLEELRVWNEHLAGDCVEIEIDPMTTTGPRRFLRFACPDILTYSRAELDGVSRRSLGSDPARWSDGNCQVLSRRVHARHEQPGR